MESLTRPINLMEISYPVFKIGEETPSFNNGVCYYFRQYSLDFGEVKNKLLVIDDTNIKKDTLAKRRLELLENKVSLKKLSKAVFYIGDLIKLSNRTSWFIDSVGKVFQYKKTKSVSLEFRRIAKVIALKEGGAIIVVENIQQRFKTLYTPRDSEVYAGLLKDTIGYILYGVYDKKHEKTRRMI